MNRHEEIGLDIDGLDKDRFLPDQLVRLFVDVHVLFLFHLFCSYQTKALILMSETRQDNSLRVT